MALLEYFVSALANLAYPGLQSIGFISTCLATVLLGVFWIAGLRYFSGISLDSHFQLLPKSSRALLFCDSA